MTPDKKAPDIATLRAMDADSYADVDLNRLLLYAMGWLRDRSLPLYFEFITVVSFRLFPEKFSLRGFDHPDSNRVNRGLLQLGPKYRNWARGKTSTGWALTPEGEAILEQTREVFREGAGPRSPVRSRPRTRSGSYTLDPQEELTRLRGTAAFKTYEEHDAAQLRIDDVWEVVGAFAYTPVDSIKARLKVLSRLAMDANDETAVDFLRALDECLKRSDASRGRHA